MLNGTRIQSDSKPDERDWLDVSRCSVAATSLPSALDFDEARRFLTHLDGDAERFLFGSHDDSKVRIKALIADAKANGRSKPNTYQSRCASLDDPDLRRWMPERQAAGWAITVSAQAMKAGKRLISEVAYIRVIFAEMDIGEPLRPWPLEPSMVVETSPGRYHVYWLILSEAPITEEDFHGIMMCLCELYGADPDAKDLARTMRLPGTWNLKPERPPHLVKIVRQSGARYSGHELVAAFPPPPRAEPKSTGQRPKLNGYAPPGLERFGGENGPLKAISPDNYGDWLRVGMALHEESGGSADGLSLWDQWSAASEKWSAGVCDAKWNSFRGRKGVTGGTIFAMAVANGWKKPEASTSHQSFSSFRRFSRGARPNADQATEPPEPLPLVRALPPAEPYPVHALGSAMGAAARAFQAKTQAPMDICANAVLAVAGLAAQPHADVHLPTGEIKPLSLYLVTVARSGERKTSTDSLALGPVKQREADLRVTNETALLDHQNAHAAWDAERKKILNNKKLEMNSRKLALDELGAEPKPPLSPILVCHEPTFEGLAKLLINGQPSIGIFASEGGAFIGGHGFTDEAKLRTAAGFSLLWDDGRLTRVRAGEGATALVGKRVALTSAGPARRCRPPLLRSDVGRPRAPIAHPGDRARYPARPAILARCPARG